MQRTTLHKGIQPSSDPKTLTPSLHQDLQHLFKNFTLSTLQNSMFRKKKGKTSIQQHALKPFIEIDSFQDPKSDLYGKMSQIDSFQDPYVLHHKWTHFKTLMFLNPN